MLFVTSGGTMSDFSPAYPCNQFPQKTRLDSTAIYSALIMAFPGSGREFPIQPGEAKMLAMDAIDHRAARSSSEHTPAPETSNTLIHCVGRWISDNGVSASDLQGVRNEPACACQERQLFMAPRCHVLFSQGIFPSTGNSLRICPWCDVVAHGVMVNCIVCIYS